MPHLKIAQWHTEAGGYNGRIAGHALRLLNEAIELCIVAGASAGEISSRVGAEIAKAANRGEFEQQVTFEAVRAELADVIITADVVAHYTGNVNMDIECTHKLEILKERKWEADSDGVLWRPGRIVK